VDPGRGQLAHRQQADPRGVARFDLPPGDYEIRATGKWHQQKERKILHVPIRGPLIRQTVLMRKKRQVGAPPIISAGPASPDQGISETPPATVEVQVQAIDPAQRNQNAKPEPGGRRRTHHYYPQGQLRGGTRCRRSGRG
jgi:hypothetical protein